MELESVFVKFYPLHHYILYLTSTRFCMKKQLLIIFLIIVAAAQSQTRVLDSVRKSLFPDFNPATSTLILNDKKNDPKIDSLLAALSKEKNPTIRVQLLNQYVDNGLIGTLKVSVATGNKIGLSFLKELVALKRQLNHPDYGAYQKQLQFREINDPSSKNIERFQLIKQAIELFDQFNNSIPALLSTLRLYYYSLNIQEERYQYYEQKLKLYTTRNNRPNMAACYHALGGYYNIKAAYNRAISNYLKAADIYKEYNTGTFCNSLSVAADEYANWGNPTRGELLVDSTISIGFRLSNLAILKNSFGQANTIALIGKKYEKCISYCDSLIKYCVNGVSDFDFLSRIFTEKGICLIETGKPEDGLSNLAIAQQLADSIRRAFNTNFGALEIDYGKFLYYSKKDQPQKALAYLTMALQKANESKVADAQKKYLAAFKDYYASINDFTHYKLYNNQLDSLTKETDASLAPLKISYYEIEKKELQQLDSLNTMKQKNAIQNALIQKNNLLLWISLIGILVVVFALYYVNRQLQINKKNLNTLKSTQQQLIQSEKMASLGELTAGIAHEIQNPLNFVNNFSELNNELLQELGPLDKLGVTADQQDILKDLQSNSEKINHHGQRAAAIVKGMLQHSRTSSGQKEPTDINALCDEYLRLAYHGLRAKDKNFNAEFKTEFDETIPKVNIVPQDMGRVVLNLINNAFFAVGERGKEEAISHKVEAISSEEKGIPSGLQLTPYSPTVTVSTKNLGNKIEITVSDNGTGIPSEIKEKIFQPFFTTKPTGQGTGLGLSLAYDIVTKVHGGKLTVESEQGKGTTFKIEIPMSP